MSFDTTGLIEKIHKHGGSKYYEDDKGNIFARECTNCKDVKPLHEFNKSKRGLCGRRSNCKACDSKKALERARMNPKRTRDNFKRWAARNKKYRAEYMAEWRMKNREKIKIWENAYKEKNPHIQRMSNIRRRARLRNLPDNLTHDQKESIFEYFGRSCALTNKPGEVHFDHVIPLATGHGGTTYENMIPLRADLNISKSDRNIFDWFADNRDRFGLEQRKFDELIEYLADINGMTTKEYEEYVRWCHDNPRTVDETKAEETSRDDAS